MTVCSRLLGGLAGFVLLAGLVGCDAGGDPVQPEAPASAVATSQAPSGAPSDAAPAVDETVLRRDLAAQYTGDHAAPSAREEGRCFADALLRRTDPAALQAAGVVGPDGRLAVPFPVLDEATAEQWVAAQGECTDFVTASVDAFAAQSKGRIDQAAYARCLRAEIEPGRVREALVAALSGGLQSPAVAELTQAQSTCAASALPQD